MHPDGIELNGGGLGSQVRIPVSSLVCFLREEKLSWRGVMMPCTIPIKVLSPKVTRNTKMMMAQKAGLLNTETMSVNATRATPGPSITWKRRKGRAQRSLYRVPPPALQPNPLGSCLQHQRRVPLASSCRRPEDCLLPQLAVLLVGAHRLMWTIVRGAPGATVARHGRQQASS